jgi:uncharacterized protein
MVGKFCVAFALSLAVASPALADVKTGVEAWSRGEYPLALKEWRPLAINGDADAQFNMGQAYKLGRGVPLDLQQAEDWYRKAALQGHMQAEDNFGLVMFQNGNRQKALPWIEKSAARGEPRAQYIYGTTLFNGDLAPKDWTKAYALMTRASASGLPAASSSLAQMDRYIPMEQRQKGLAMARDMELAAQRPRISPTQSASVIPPRPLPQRPMPSTGPVARPVDLPPSQEEVAVQMPPAEPDYEASESLPPISRPVVARPVAVRPPQPAVVRPTVVRPSTAPSPRAAPSGKQWRVQLGAFGEEGRARALFTQLENRISALQSLQPVLVKAGKITRLQAGPLANQNAAEQLCGKVRASGQSCLVVAP